jgi:hypothetical protein
MLVARPSTTAAGAALSTKMKYPSGSDFPAPPEPLADDYYQSIQSRQTRKWGTGSMSGPFSSGGSIKVAVTLVFVLCGSVSAAVMLCGNGLTVLLLCCGYCL